MLESGNGCVLQTRTLSKRYGKRLAVNKLDLEVAEGDIYGFLGPNGAGKSTTIRMILTLIRPTEGSVQLFGTDVRSDRAPLARVGGLVEKPDFYNYLSARKNLEIVSALYGSVDKKRIDEVLAIVGLSDRGDDRVKAYSHGMKQRLGIAQALLPDPALLILDEPTNGLDPHGMKEVRELIRRLNAEHGMTIFLSSHLLNEIEQVANRMCILHKGELVVQGTVKELLDKEAVTVRITAEPKEQAASLLQSMDWVNYTGEENGELTCTIAENDLARTNGALIEAGVQVSGFSPRRSLEDYFISITGEAEAL
ncbi:MAG: bacitracin ABC transporter ATP-binding protein [Ectothiorhodospiraceae bacterium]|nr:bacitracin ABC transporter ATP-binding protein [Ectothiorhodospiraceae bacterium]